MRLLYPACLILSLLPSAVVGMSIDRREELKEQTGRLFVHGYEGYMEHAYPADELRPLSCAPLHRDPNAANFGINDIHANVSMTLLDILSTLPLIHPSALPDALEKVTTAISFDQDVKVQVFEMTIRALGALLSTYQYLQDLPSDGFERARLLGLSSTWSGEDKVDITGYSGRVLELALDLGERLLPAFNTPTGIPYARVNLRYGVETGESIETCSAGAGSLILEFSVLSRLTGDDRFEKLAHAAYMAIWNRRSTHNLVGNTVGVTHGQWLAPGLSGVGAGMDSFFEYGMKAGIMLGDDTYLDIFHDAYAAIQTHVRTSDGYFYRPVQYRSLHPSSPTTIDSLSAFFPSVQVLAGDLESAIKGHLVFWNLWRRYSAIPESWDIDGRSVEWTGWPGRPEFIESTYYLYRATKDPFYLRVGERVLNDIERRVKTSCGFASLSDVTTGELEDRMESFVLSETLKYLYLLFDSSPQPHSNKVFTTEGHPLCLPVHLQTPPSPSRWKLHNGENLFCPSYKRPTLNGLVVGIERRADYDYARSLVFGKTDLGVIVEDEDRVKWWEGGTCNVPVIPKFSFDVTMGPTNVTSQTIEDASPSGSKVFRNGQGNLVVSDVEGIKFGVRWRFDGTGYDVSHIGPHRVRAGQQVLLTDPKMSSHLLIPSDPPPTTSPPELILRFSLSTPSLSTPNVFLHALGATATFGHPLGSSPQSEAWGIGNRFELHSYPVGNEDGCSSIPLGSGGLITLHRGGCTFLQKSLHASQAGYIGVIIIGSPPPLNGGTQPQLFRPSADDVTDLSEELQGLVKRCGMIYVDSMVGGVLDGLEEGKVWVELLDINGLGGAGDYGSSPDRRQEGGNEGKGIGKGKKAKGGQSGKEKESRGRLVVGDWDIRNLRIVKPP